MEKIKIFIDDVEYLVNDIDTIYNTCKNLGIDVPTLYLENDISYVVANDQHVDATKELICYDIRIYINHNATSEDEKNRICNLYNMTKHNCTLCPATNCKLSKMYDKYELNKEKEDTYLNCAYFKKGVKTHVLNLVEVHPSLEDVLKDKNIHKVAIIDRNLSPKKAEILNRGFNEVITNDFVKKFKIIEESTLILKEIAKDIDKRENKLPCCILEDDSLKSYVPHELRKNIINVGTLEDLTKRILTYSVDVEKVKVVFIKENDFVNYSNEIVSLDYILNLPTVDNLIVDNISKLLKLDDKEVNYNTFIKHMLDIFKSKQEYKVDIYKTPSYVINLGKKDIVIKNGRLSCENANILLFLSSDAHNITESIIDDNDVNYIYKNYIKYPGTL